MNEVSLTPTYEDVHKACDGLVKLIKELGMNFGIVVGISRGGLVPGVIISQMLDLPFKPIEYSSKEGAGDDKNHDNFLPILPRGNRILIVDDICDTGKTMQEVVEYYKIHEYNIYTYVLYYKQQLNPVSYRPDLHWRTIGPKSSWIHFPWESK